MPTELVTRPASLPKWAQFWSEKMSLRTSKGLIDTLFDELDSLTAGKTTPQHARAVASVATTICSVSRLEMDYARFVAEPRSQIEDGGLTALPMGTEDAA
jgi:hypothetical protein